MGRCCVREELDSGVRDAASELTVALTGSAIAVACLACVAWSVIHDRGMQSELVAEGASQIIEPAEPKTIVRVPHEAIPRTLLTLDLGENVAASPVVNAHLEVVGDADSPRKIDVSSMIRQLRSERRSATESAEGRSPARLKGGIKPDPPTAAAARPDDERDRR